MFRFDICKKMTIKVSSQPAFSLGFLVCRTLLAIYTELGGRLVHDTHDAVLHVAIVLHANVGTALGELFLIL